jgi:hypothetical protein
LPIGPGWPKGRPRLTGSGKIRLYKAIDRVTEDLTKATAHLPATVIGEWTIAELLADGARLGLMRLREFASRICDEGNERARFGRLGNNGLSSRRRPHSAKLLATVQLETMRRKADEQQFSAFLATVDAFEAQLYGPTNATVERQRAKAAERPATVEKHSSQSANSTNLRA